MKDFNAVVESIVFSKTKTPLVVFTFSDAYEKSSSFLQKVFSEHVMTAKGSLVQILNLNPLTDASIDKTLHMIVQCEQVSNLSDKQLVDIRVKCNRDLRNAI